MASRAAATAVDVGLAESDASDYESYAIGQDEAGEMAGARSAKPALGGLGAALGKNVGAMVWEAGKEQARTVWSFYGNIDLLRPYFDVEPRDVLMRLIQSLMPKVPSAKPVRIHRELYGPTMLILTLIALLLYQMKMSDHVVREGTLMGTAFATCFGYWVGASSLMWFVTYVNNSRVTYVQLMSLLGYATLSHCVVVLLTTLVHTSHDHFFFYALWLAFGGLASLRMMSILTSRTPGRTPKLVVGSAVAALHMFYLMYLHFAYHRIVEEVAIAFEEKLERPPAVVLPSVQPASVARLAAMTLAAVATV